MKKTIVVVLMVVMVATPCFAQEIETDGILSLDGTVWQAEQSLQVLPFPDTGPNFKVGFYRGRVHKYLREIRGFYVDMLALSIFYAISGRTLFFASCETGLMFPAVGLGIEIAFGFGHLIPFFHIALLNKTEDNWIPEEIIEKIDPNQGEQGTTLINVDLSSSNTTFRENLPVEISFVPPDGLVVSNINVVYNDRIRFDLEIAVDAPLGMKRVIVVYDDGNKILEEDNAFEVLPGSK